jgi:hypothetical protein
MAKRFRGVAHVTDNPDAGFRAATQKAVDKYKEERGAPDPGSPVRLRVADMYVDVQNPIHGYIVDLETDD